MPPECQVRRVIGELVDKATDTRILAELEKVRSGRLQLAEALLRDRSGRPAGDGVDFIEEHLEEVVP